MTNRELRAQAAELAQKIGVLMNDAEQLRHDLAAAARAEQPGTLVAGVGLAGLTADLTNAQRALTRACQTLS